MLTYYSADRELLLSCDASPYVWEPYYHTGWMMAVRNHWGLVTHALTC